MQRDPQVRACLTTKRLAVLSESAEVHPADDSTPAKEAADLVRRQMEAVPGGVAGIVTGALDALAMGYAVGELVWALDGELEAVRWHDPRRFCFEADDFGQVYALGLLDSGLSLARSRFVVYSYQSRYGNPYGESDLIAAYRPWSQKDSIGRMWLVALDRFGSPVPVAKVPLTWNQDEIDHLSRLLARLQNESSLVLTSDVEIDIPLDTGRVEPARAFATASQYCNTEIARAILGQELTSQSGSEGSGSYALGKVHQSVTDDWVQSLRSEIAETVLTGQVARQICAYHLGPDALCPTVRFPNLTPEELTARRELVNQLVSGAVIAPNEKWVRGWLGIPEAAS